MADKVSHLVSAEQREIAYSNGIIYETLMSRLRYGWPIDVAITKPIREKVDSDELIETIRQHDKTKIVVELLNVSPSTVRRARTRVFGNSAS